MNRVCVAQNGRRIGVAQINVETLPVTVRVTFGKSGEADIDAAPQIAARFDLAQRLSGIRDLLGINRKSGERARHEGHDTAQLARKQE